MLDLNALAATLCDQVMARAERLAVRGHEVAGARVIDFGVEATGGLAAGLWLARICLADLATVTLVPAREGASCAQSVQVHTDHPLASCLGSQYAGWPVQSEDFFAMGSGPMRLLRGREPMLEELFDAAERSAADRPSVAVGVLESDRLPTAAAIEEVAQACGVEPSQLTLCVAPVTSLAGVVQVVARSVETAMHKLHEVGLSAGSIRSGWGVAPLPPPATDTIGGIGRTNDAILYAGQVTLWSDADQGEIDRLGPRVPSDSSSDHGKPFAEIFQHYEYDFYKVDPGLFSPALVEFVNLRSGVARSFGRACEEVLRRSLRTADASDQGPGRS